MDPDGRKARDTGLRRVAGITKASLSGALAGTVVFAGLAYQHRSATSPNATRSSTPTSRDTSPGIASNGDDDGGSRGASSTFDTPPNVQLAPSGGGFSPIVSGAS